MWVCSTLLGSRGDLRVAYCEIRGYNDSNNNVPKTAEYLATNKWVSNIYIVHVYMQTAQLRDPAFAVFQGSSSGSQTSIYMQLLLLTFLRVYMLKYMCCMVELECTLYIVTFIPFSFPLSPTATTTTITTTTTTITTITKHDCRLGLSTLQKEQKST